MTGFFDKLPEISPKKQAPTQKPVFDPYSFLNLRPEPQTAEDRFKEAKELLSAESNTAIQYLKAAAEEEHAASLDFLGMLYATGQLLERDPKRAADLFRKAAVLGETNAKFHLAMALREGFGVRQNLDESFAWLRVAAKEKSPEAMFALAEAYDQGLGVETNPEIAETFFSQAALKGEKRAIMRMVRLTSEGSHLNPKLCLHWLFKGAAAKIPVCLLAVGRYWLETTPKSPVRGLGFLEEGALSEDPDCLLELGFFWSTARFVAPDIVAAIVYCHLASTFGSWKASQKLSDLRALAQKDQLMEAAGIAAFPSSQLVVQEIIKRRNDGA